MYYCLPNAEFLDMYIYCVYLPSPCRPIPGTVGCFVKKSRWSFFAASYRSQEQDPAVFPFFGSGSVMRGLTLPASAAPGKDEPAPNYAAAAAAGYDDVVFADCNIEQFATSSQFPRHC